MAKWGEGDPRWIVEERPDATNVNNWHWTEKNAGPWSTERFRELFKNLIIESELAELTIKEIEKCEGEASANNRKGKLIFFYEWHLILKWAGKLRGGSENLIEGKVTIPNLSEENNVDEVEITVTVNNSDDESEILKEIMREQGRRVIRKQFENYISSLREEFSRGMILPSKECKTETINNLTSGFNKKINMKHTTGINRTGESEIEKKCINLQTEDFSETFRFQCLGEELYNALTMREMVNAWTRGAMDELDAKPGGVFSFFGGNVTGKFITLEPSTRIIQSWRYKQWPEEHHSTVTFDINQKSDHTELCLTQKGVPKTEIHVTINNWDRYYWDSIKRVFGWGSFINYST